MLRLTQAGLADVVRQTWPDVGAPPADAALYLALPDPKRIYGYLDRIDDVERRVELEGLATSRDLPPVATVAQHLVERTVSLLGWPPLRVAHVTTGSHASVTEALAAAAHDLVSAPRDASVQVPSVAIVGGVDTLLDAETLTWLLETRQLKHPDNPVGIEPGEAAAFLVLRREPEAGRIAASGRQDSLPSPILGYMAGAQVGAASPPGTPSGVALDAAISAAAQEAGEIAPPAWLLVDQDGTTDRSTELGSVLVRMRQRGLNVGPELLCPAVSFGDVGVASGAVAACLAMAAWNRGWAPARVAYVACGAGSTTASSCHVLIGPNGTSGS